MSSLYFECADGISGDMACAALLDLGADGKKLDNALNSLSVRSEFDYEIKNVFVNSIKACDFNVILKHNEHHHIDGGQEGHSGHHHHRNLDDIYTIIKSADITENARALAEKIFKITAEAEAAVHGKSINEVHFHEIGAVDSIVDVISFAVLFDDLNPGKVYFKSLTEGSGRVKCAHGVMSVPVPAVSAIAAKYRLPLRITDNDGEMITPTGASIAAALYTGEKLPAVIIPKKIGSGAGKRPYPNPVLRVISIDE